MNAPRANTIAAFFAASERMRAAAGWTLVGALIVIEFLWFRGYLLREVVWAYPPNTDQLVYLQQSYETYERTRAVGISRAIADEPAAPQGALMQIEAALLYRALGASRFSALMLNFIHFAAFQVCLVWAVRWMSRRWAMAFIALGLLLTSLTPFYRAGGLSDFRMDLIALCLYGIFVCLVVRSSMFLRWRWAAVAGLGGAVLVAFRFIAGAYLALTFAAMLIFVLSGFLRNRGNAVAKSKVRQLAGLLIAGGLIAAITVPVLWSRRAAIHDYYVVGHVTGAEKAIRAAETGTTRLWASLAYYPGVLLKFHAGFAFVVLATVLLLAGAALAFGRRHAQASSPIASDRFPLADGFAFVAACLLVPLLILTLDVSKSPVVANIMIAPLVWLVVLLMVRLIGADQPGPQARRVEWVLALLAGVAVLAGLRTQHSAYAHDHLMSRRRGDVENLIRLSDVVAARAKEAGWESPSVFSDNTADYLGAQVVKVLTYERHGYLLDIGDQFGTVGEVPTAEVFKLLNDSDFVFVSTQAGRPPAYEYPFNEEMQRLHPEIAAFCTRSRKLLGQYHVFNRDVAVFSR